MNSTSPGWGKGTNIRDGDGQKRLPKTKYWIWGLKNVRGFTTRRPGAGGQVEVQKQNKEQAYLIQSSRMSSSLQL